MWCSLQQCTHPPHSFISHPCCSNDSTSSTKQWGLSPPLLWKVLGLVYILGVLVCVTFPALLTVATFFILFCQIDLSGYRSKGVLTFTLWAEFSRYVGFSVPFRWSHSGTKPSPEVTNMPKTHILNLSHYIMYCNCSWKWAWETEGTSAN